jgi:hypothetical protein
MFAKFAPFEVFAPRHAAARAGRTAHSNDNQAVRVRAVAQRRPRPILACRWHVASADGRLACDWGLESASLATGDDPAMRMQARELFLWQPAA